ncbi:probable PAM17 Presequence translocase-associated motor subunit, required for stable complex formation between cochaperones Pam16p and Pam18p [Phialocephala subalpina]|uniref:Presequence translocated-associated motor subunit PAM17 n=1 Tax=Phialocephala subalpina TaxID=576137 RepID=A0A1L7WE58_9HELO|nr:probable PAM17 Presequence translocase-associated motor subunit, required for stable complex formation between cochaperones Pam16p and Pam18p [Phialocephala subalpina]
MLGAAPTLRTAAIGCRLQPTLLTPCTYSTTTSPSPLQPKESSTTSKRRVPIARHNVAFKSTPSTIRYASSVSSSPQPTTSTDSQAISTEKLDWNTFFKLRKTRRWYQLGSSIGTGIGGFVGGAQVLTRSDMDAIVGQIPLDPFITLGLITFTCGGVGWLAGPIVGTAVFNWRNRKFRGQMDEKEKEFYRRIKRYRVDPSASSMANPVPDYYGEKISSVAGYRQWLKDQRAFNKKRTTYIKY